MKPPVDNVKLSSKGRDVLIQAKRHTGLKQWNELLRWGFCISLSNPDSPRATRKLDAGIDPVEWSTFAGADSQFYAAAFYHRASKDGIDLMDQDAIGAYFRAHIERGVAALRSLKSLTALVSVMES